MLDQHRGAQAFNQLLVDAVMISAAAQVEESAKDKADELADNYEEQKESKAIVTPQWFGKKEEIRTRQPMPWNTPVVAHLPLGCLNYFLFLVLQRGMPPHTLEGGDGQLVIDTTRSPSKSSKIGLASKKFRSRGEN